MLEFQEHVLDSHVAEPLIARNENTGNGIVCRLVVLILGGAFGAFFFGVFLCTMAGFGIFIESFSVASNSFMFSMHGVLLAARIVYCSIQFFRDVDTELKSIGGSLIKQVLFGATCLLIQTPINWVVSQTPYDYGFSFFSFWFPRIILPLFLGWILIYSNGQIRRNITDATRIWQPDRGHDHFNLSSN
jgi:hypothetical protein